MNQGRTGRALAHIRRNAIAYMALFAAVGGGTAVAAKKIKLPKGSVGAKQLKAGAVDSSKVANGSLKAEDLAPGTIPAATAQTPATPAPTEVVERTFRVAASGSSDELLAAPAGLGEVRANCNTTGGGAVLLGYNNTTSGPIHLIQQADYDTNAPDQREFSSTTAPPAAVYTGNFTNYAQPQLHTIELISDEASPSAARVTVAARTGGGFCTFHVITLGG